MRVFYAAACTRVVEGSEDWLEVAGRLTQEITAEIDQQLQELPREIMRMFNAVTAPEGQTIDYASDPLVYMPDEFAFKLDIESLDRLARECLLEEVPGEAAIWQTKHVPIADLYLGGKGEPLDAAGREAIRQMITGAQRNPVKGKVFVFGRSLSDELRDLAAHATRVAGGLVEEKVTDVCDYYVTDREEEVQTARAAGARNVIDTLTHRVMLERPR